VSTTSPIGTRLAARRAARACKQLDAGSVTRGTWKHDLPGEVGDSVGNTVRPWRHHRYPAEVARPADALPDPVIVLIDDESSALSDEQIANETAELLASLASGPVIDLDDLDIAELIRQDRADRGA